MRILAVITPPTGHFSLGGLELLMEYFRDFTVY